MNILVISRLKSSRTHIDLNFTITKAHMQMFLVFDNRQETKNA